LGQSAFDGWRRSNVVTAVEIKDRHAADTNLLPYLVDMTAENFDST